MTNHAESPLRGNFPLCNKRELYDNISILNPPDGFTLTFFLTQWKKSDDSSIRNNFMHLLKDHQGCDYGPSCQHFRMYVDQLLKLCQRWYKSPWPGFHVSWGFMFECYKFSFGSHTVPPHGALLRLQGMHSSLIKSLSFLTWLWLLCFMVSSWAWYPSIVYMGAHYSFILK